MDDDLDALMSEIESAGLVGGSGGVGSGKVGGGGRIPTASGAASASSNAPVVARASSLAPPRRGLPSYSQDSPPLFQRALELVCPCLPETPSKLSLCE